MGGQALTHPQEVPFLANGACTCRKPPETSTSSIWSSVQLVVRRPGPEGGFEYVLRMPQPVQVSPYAPPPVLPELSAVRQPAYELKR